MNDKENPGGELTNKEIEQDRKITDANKDYNYTGSQDNGDQAVRAYGTEVQKKDGFIEDKDDSEKGNRKA